MNRMDILFVEHLINLKTPENQIMIEAVMDGFAAMLESRDEIVPDHELAEMSDSAAEAKLNDIIKALRSVKGITDAQVEKFLGVARSRLFTDRLAIQGR